MKENLSFEKNMEMLGKIVAQLEKGDVPLEKSVELYAEGVRLSAECKKQLQEARIKIIENGGNTESEEQNYE